MNNALNDAFGPMEPSSCDFFLEDDKLNKAGLILISFLFVAI